MLSTSASSQASNHPVHNRFDDSQMLFGIVFVPLPVSSLPIFIVSLLSTCQGSDSFCKAQECMANSFRNRWPGREAVEKFSPLSVRSHGCIGCLGEKLCFQEPPLCLYRSARVREKRMVCWGLVLDNSNRRTCPEGLDAVLSG